ncbi:glycosyl hydrolase 115 family protein [Bacteroides oleiciplenus]|uniref:Gylcosyl hydrolase 115 C-terminal domain-containing protein n=1 Tax=Bacteroides oleiciplenus YIT 12058 TaxID=742727 RepID=K9DVI8_9BACE|nr:glycosyl hydrolase 115 family protein [Bacteroides oleiciplenus]EKU88458.1 hypothetical protein HMPREF9447_04515 [Bacteroides oleiciplenus YIT 12058]
MKYIIFLFFFLCFGLIAQGQVIVKETDGEQAFPLVSSNSKALISYDENDFEVVKETARLFAEDIRNVTGKRIALSDKQKAAAYMVIIGTIGQNRTIDRFVREGKLDVSPIRNGWEQYIIQTLDNPDKGIQKALVIAGCDRRGTAYGVLSLSEVMGVDPLYWWADVPVKQKNTLYVHTTRYISKAPSVKYRGIFINDEGWGIQPWATNTFDKEVGNMGPKTYAKVCELILRMKGNMMAPAMHPKTTAFNLVPGNREVADKYGIVVTSAHCEPLLYNNTTEWDNKINGEWNYLTNKEGILKVLDKRTFQTAPFENAYVIAMRGIHDAGLIGVPEDRKAEVTEEALQDQRNILSKHIGKPAEEIQQVFVPYKEVLDIYEKGMKLPDDVTIVWPDDNFGYIKKLSDVKEQKRSGASGVYYHISYLGEPHDYLWLNTTPPALIYEEMKKAYDTGANRYWLLNVGDIKPGELGIKFFLDLAWDIDLFNYDNAYQFDANYLSSIFGDKYKDDLQDIMSTYYQLGFQRKPEAMGWGVEWNSSDSRERIVNTDFSFINYNEAENRIAEYDRIANKSERILKELPDKYKAAFYELVFYPVKGATLMNKKMLTAQQNRWYALQGRASTELYASKVRSYHDSIGSYTAHYNQMLNGKWNHMMSLAPGWVATYQNMPPVNTTTISSGTNMQIFIPGKDTDYGVTSLNVLPCLNPYTKQKSFIELYNRGDKAFQWKASARQEWINLDKTSGEALLQDRIILSVDWTKVPHGTNITGEIVITSGQKTETVYLPIFNPVSPSVNELKGMYVEDNGCISINPGLYHRKLENKDITIHTIKGLGYENECVQLGEAVKPSQNIRKLAETPRAEYDFYTFSAGTVTVYTYALPLFPINTQRNTRYGVMIDDGIVHWVSTAAKEYSGQWKQNVVRNNAIGIVNLNIEKPGKHTLKLLCADPGMVIQKVIIDFGGMKRSYLGPQPTLVK